MESASEVSTDRSLEMKLELQADRLVAAFRTRLKQLLKDGEPVEKIKKITWDHLFKVLDGKYKKASNIIEVLESTEKKLYDLIDELAKTNNPRK